MNLKERIESFYAQDLDKIDRRLAIKAFNELKFFLNCGDVRAAAPSEACTNTGGWMVNDWVKKGILLGFRLGELSDISIDENFRYFDKNTYPLKKITLENQIRIVPGGSSIRDGSYIAPGVMIMPPAYANVGAYIDSETMIDSHALVGSCAQLGKRIHVSAAAQIGGVLEPIGAMPVIIEDDVFIGGNSGIFEGTIVKNKAVIAAGVILTGSTPVYDLIKEKIYRKTDKAPLVIPEGAVVVPGTRAVSAQFGQEHKVSIYAPVIIKYRDYNTDAATILEESLR
ncbi:MAG: 2,3,4,5-tetrahydropyridine-2,6-dicarboxylate N-succinyltransferase [Bacteroidetes bacterium]|nr:2,3,4,5-tetrahydropyridine-2,6-dicarboxylate N-succinyltransferase [Bacteroidota bacterium]